MNLHLMESRRGLAAYLVIATPNKGSPNQQAPLQNRGSVLRTVPCWNNAEPIGGGRQFARDYIAAYLTEVLAEKIVEN